MINRLGMVGVASAVAVAGYSLYSILKTNPSQKPLGPMPVEEFFAKNDPPESYDKALGHFRSYSVAKCVHERLCAVNALNIGTDETSWNLIGVWLDRIEKEMEEFVRKNKSSGRRIVCVTGGGTTGGNLRDA
eukprot:258794-Amorphochlora_amoeboformis.AAC.1